MDENRYLLKHTDEIITPCLIYYKDIIEQNITEMISAARISLSAMRLYRPWMCRSRPRY